MPEVSAISSATANATPQSNARAASVDYDTFLQLLVAELQNQDPTKPMDSAQYIAQLASFSNVEQSIQTNDKLDQLLNSSFISSAGSLIGKTITSADGSVSGQIVQVKVSNNSGLAVLADGREVAVNDRVTIGQ